MTPNDAYQIILAHFNGDELTVVSCEEYKDYYAFYIGDSRSKNSSMVFVGGFAHCVFKKDGKYEKIDINKLPNESPIIVNPEEIGKEQSDGKS